MPRPVRIEYEGAFHHVMNRGRNQQTIFHDSGYFDDFLKTLEEASESFDAIIHAYCLMSNHYHLLIETPKANLSRIMQHINGIYTQRYNRRRKQDGSLFRGRYKSVLVDQDEYLLQLSRYIHRNPLEVKKKMVVQLEDYSWSSYPAYINRVKAPDWLHRDKTYQMLGQKQRYKGYQNYVEKGVDEDLKRFYNKGNILSVLGSREFKESRREESEETDLTKLRQLLQDRPSMSEMLDILCGVVNGCRQSDICQRQAGKGKSHPLRAFAMYLCQHYCGVTHKEITEYFGLTHAGSISNPITRIRKEIDNGHWGKEIEKIEKHIYIVKCT